MTTEQTAQQLELAAQILRTGHPWGYRRIAGGRYKYNTPIEVVADGNSLSLLLATPPDNRPLHNPDNLTADQVGVGYRLTVEGESVPGVGAEWWCRSSSAWLTSTGAYLPQRNTVRVPLKTPWPEPVDPYAELKAAHAAGKVIQGFIRGHWLDSPHPTWRYPVDTYRIKPDEPQTKTVPLSPEDVRCGDEIMDEYQLRRCVITVGNDGVSLGGEGFIAYIHLTGRKIRRRDSDEFVPCSKQIPA